MKCVPSIPKSYACKTSCEFRLNCERPIDLRCCARTKENTELRLFARRSTARSTISAFLSDGRLMQTMPAIPSESAVVALEKDVPSGQCCARKVS